MAFSIEARQTRSTQAQASPFTPPDIGVEAQQLATQLGHIRADLKGLFKLHHRLIDTPLAFKSNSKANMGRNTLRVSAQDLVKRRFSLIKLTLSQVGLTQNPVCFQILREVGKNMLGHTYCLWNLIGLQVVAGLIVSGLQAHGSHAKASWCTLQVMSRAVAHSWMVPPIQPVAHPCRTFLSIG